MRTVYFTLPRMNISLESSEDVLAKVSLIYPFYVQSERPEFIAHAYGIEKKGDGWEWSKDGQVQDTVLRDLDAVFRLEYDVEITLLQRCEHWLAFHAGCVAVGDKACLVAGNPDTGKTTTTFHLVEMGHRFMCEEIAFLDAETCEVHPFLQTPSIERRFIEGVKQDFPIERGEISPIDLSVVRYRPEHIQKEPLKLSTILVPKREADAEPEIISLNPGEFLTEFLSYCFEPNREMENFLDSVIDVLQRVQIYRLCYKDFVDCRKLLLSFFPPVSA